MQIREQRLEPQTKRELEMEGLLEEPEGNDPWDFLREAEYKERAYEIGRTHDTGRVAALDMGATGENVGNNWRGDRYRDPDAGDAGPGSNRIGRRLR